MVWLWLHPVIHTLMMESSSPSSTSSISSSTPPGVPDVLLLLLPCSWCGLDHGTESRSPYRVSTLQCEQRKGKVILSGIQTCPQRVSLSRLSLTTVQTAFDVSQNIIQATPTLAHLSGDVLLTSFCPEGFVGIGVPIGTDAFAQDFVAKTCKGYYRWRRKIVRYSRRIYALSGPQVLADLCKIAETLLKKGTKQTPKTLAH